FLLYVKPDVALARPADMDRFEEEGERLQVAVANAYEQLAARHPERYVRVPADRSPEEVHAQVMAEVESRLGATR
ncbi:MAG: dTMP kinase, partial [Dehalococcoidia bacterium]